MSADAAEIRRRFDEIVRAMQKCGAWDAAQPADTAFDDMGAFGMNTMSFEQWLRYVFVPRVESLIESDGPWPGSSEVGVHAMRELDGVLEAQELAASLSRFDELFEDE